MVAIDPQKIKIFLYVAVGMLALIVVFGALMIVRMRKTLGGAPAKGKAAKAPQPQGGNEGGFPAKLARIAASEAAKGYHGALEGIAPSFEPVLCHFAGWELLGWNDEWNAAFVYHCCALAGAKLPTRVDHPAISSNFADGSAWVEWAKLNGLYQEKAPALEAGDVLAMEGDRLAIVVRCDEKGTLVAQGDVRNIACTGILKQGTPILGVIRFPKDGV